MERKRAPILISLLAILFIAQAVFQSVLVFPRWAKDYAPKKTVQGQEGISPDQLLFALIGFRELVAGILWVRADSFFDTGNYDAILPIVRVVTILDPHQLDVYATGMWHIGYNFTDEEQRSDRRYVPSALALGKEGSENNPQTYELFFETGWLWYHKIDDYYDNAVLWFKKAHERPDILPARRNILAMAYQRAGRVEEARDLYSSLYAQAAAKYDDTQEWTDRQNRDTLENNLDTTLVRMAQRGYIAGKEGRSLQPYDVYPPFDVGFSVKATVVDPRVIRFDGTWNVLPVGTRVRVVLKDADFSKIDSKDVPVPGSLPAALEWDFSKNVVLDPPKGLTYMQDQLFVRNRAFGRKIDMSKDPTMYPFTTDKYVLEFYYNPRSAPPHIQDKFSWNGEGMTDKNYLNTEVREGQRVVFARMYLTKDQIMRRGEWQDKPPVVRTTNYKDMSITGDADVILQIPSLRGGAK
ncbi:MAG: tetratricopeptide repeat protein [Fimbriimonas sp.]